MELSLRRAPGLGMCSTYPDSISFGQSLQCAFNPWSDTCQRLKEQADLECAQYTGAIKLPPMPPPVQPPEGATSTGPGPTVNDPQAVNDQIAAQAAAYRHAVQVYMEAQATENPPNVPHCGPFSSLSAAGECVMDLGQPIFIFGAFALMGLLIAWKK
jgi:hypothetical protein